MRSPRRVLGSVALTAFCLLSLHATASARSLAASAALQASALSPSAGLDSIMQSTEQSMMAVASCSNPDRFFAESMIPHHKGAIQMSQWELDHGSNSQLRNLSSTIIAEQTREVQQMQEYLIQLPACAPSPAPALMSMRGTNMDMGGMQMDMGSSSPGMQMNMGGMNMMAPPSQAMSPSQMAFQNSMDMNMSTPLVGKPDRDFAVEMISHHQAAVSMANVEVQYGSYPPLVTMAREIVIGQTQEIQEMRGILNAQYATSA